MKKRLSAVLLSLVILISLLPAAALAAEATAEQTSKSKQATNLDANYESNITLSLPSSEEALSTDLVIVVDASDCASNSFAQAKELMEQLQEVQADSNADIKVGVILVKGSAVKVIDLERVDSNAFLEMQAALNEIQSERDGEAFLEQFVAEHNIDGYINKGSNLHAGLMAAQEMLEGDTAVEDSRKYLISISDGLAYFFCDDAGTVMAVYGQADPIYAVDCVYPYMAKHDPGMNNWTLEGSWEDYFTGTTTQVEADGDQYSVDFKALAESLDISYSAARFLNASQLEALDGKYIPRDEIMDHATGIDFSAYYCINAYQEMTEKGYHCYYVNSGKQDGELFAPKFAAAMNQTAGQEEDIDFSEIDGDILYLLGAGSRVEDYIGSGTDNAGNAYDFDFVDEADKLILKIGDTQYTSTKLDDPVQGATSSYGFNPPAEEEDPANEYEFLLHYYKDDEEHFVWEFNVPVTNFQRAELTYTVKLTNPQEPAAQDRSYGVYDADGSAGQTALYTNNRAILTAVDSAGNESEPEEFAKPTVSYTVPGTNPQLPVLPPYVVPVEPPVLNTEDHFAYIIGDNRGYVQPNAGITRAEVATIFFRLLTDGSRDKIWSQTNPYTDVSLNNWYNNAISTMTNGAILTGYPDGMFRPNAGITRAEFATIAIRFFQDAKVGPSAFNDTIGHWAEEYINRAAEQGLIVGYPGGTFRPDLPITRAEAVTIINRVLGRHPDKDHLLPNMITWPDNRDVTAWYYADIQEATNSHDYEMRYAGSSSAYEIWRELLPVRDWEALEKAWSTANSAYNPGEVVNP